MKFQSHIPKTKHTLIFLSIFLLALAIGISIPSIKVYATDGNADEGESDQASGEYSGGPSYAKTGWIMYIVDKNGTPVSDAVYISCGGEPQGIRFLTTRLGGLNPRQVAGPVPWVSVIGADGAPFDNDQDFKGIDIKDWLLEDDGAGTKNVFNVVSDYWSEDKAIAMAKNNHSLILEPFYWMTIGGLTICATDMNWGIVLSTAYGGGNYGPQPFTLFTNTIFPQCARFQYPQFGLQTSPKYGKVTNAEMVTYALGIESITPKNSAIHTYWEPHGSPGNPEPRIPNKTGTCNIVKGYYKENLTTGAKQSLGVYYELDVTSNIIVSGEPTFELVEWRVTTATSTGVNPIAWNPPGTTSQQGKAGATLSLKDPEDCVYVLLF